MLVLYVMGALEMLNMSMFLSIFATYIRSLDGSHFYIGSIVSSGALITLLWSPIIGSFGDTNGRKSVIRICLLLSLCGNLLMCFSTSLEIIFISRLLSAFGAPVAVNLKTIMSDIAKSNDEKSAMFNKAGATIGVCFMLGALTSGFISELKNGFNYIFIIMSLVVVLSLFLTQYLPDNVTKQVKGHNSLNLMQTAMNGLEGAFGNLKKINWIRYWDLFSIKGCIDLSFGIMQSSIGLILNGTFGLKGRQLGYVFTLISIFSIITNIIMLRLKKSLYANDLGYLRVMHGTLLLVVTFIGLGMSTTVYTFMVFVATMSIARTLLDSSLTELLTSKTTETDSGSVMSTFESVMSLAGFVAPLLSAVVAHRWGEQAPLLVCVIPAFAGTLIASSQKSKTE